MAPEDDIFILVDNNALVDILLGEPEFEKAAQELRRKFPNWIAPNLCRYELGNVLRTYCRRGNVSESQASALLRAGLGLVSLCGEPDDEVIFAEANASQLSFYDATYVACAREMGLTLYTRDKAILRSCPDVARHISDV